MKPQCGRGKQLVVDGAEILGDRASNWHLRAFRRHSVPPARRDKKSDKEAH